MNQIFDNLANDPTVGAVGLAIAGAIGGLWLAAAWWTYADISRRTNVELGRLVAVAWILISTPALLPLSLATYLLARPQQTVAERRAQRLFEELAPSLDDGRCPACAAVVNPEWHRCPTCATWMASACESCGEWSAADLDTCPWCAADKIPTPSSAPARRVAIPVAPATRRGVPVAPVPTADPSPVLAYAGASPSVASDLGQSPSAAQDEAIAPRPAPDPVFPGEPDDDTRAWVPAPAAGEARPAAAFSGHRIGIVRTNRGARDRRVRDADPIAGPSGGGVA